MIPRTSPNVTANATIEEIVALAVLSMIAHHVSTIRIVYVLDPAFTKNATITKIEIVALLVTLATAFMLRTV